MVPSGGRTRHDTRSVVTSFGARRHAASAGLRRCRRCASARSPAASATVAAGLAAVWPRPRRRTAAPVAAHGPAPAEPPEPGHRCCSAGRSSRWSRIGIVVVLGVVALGRPDRSTPRIPRTRCRAGGPRRSSAAMVAIAFALMSGIERYDTTLFSIHMVQHILLMLVAAPAHRALGAGHADPAGLVARDAPSLDPAGPAFAGRPRSSRTRSSRRSCSRSSSGRRTSRRCSMRRSRTRCSTTSSTRCSWGARCSSGGRPSRSTRRRTGCRTPSGSSTCSCR